MKNKNNLTDIFCLIRDNFNKFFFSCSFFGIVFYLLSFLITPLYVSKATILPVDDEMSLQQDLFSAVGLGQSSKSKTYFEAFAIAQSKDFLWKFIEKQDLQNEVLSRSGILSSVFRDEESFSKDFQTNIFLKHFLYVDDRSKDSVIILNLKSTSGFNSQFLLIQFIDLLKREIADRKLGSEKILISNLKKQLNNEIDLSVKSLISKLIEQKEAELKVNENRPDYLFKVIDSPSLPVKPESPRRLLIFLAGLIFGFALVFLLLIREKK